jgi:hypothetical protein
MVLRKEGGKWKILVDKDTADEGKITEAMFRAVNPPVDCRLQSVECRG